MISKDDCWLWAGSYAGSGHGKIYLGWENGKTKSSSAHRAIYDALVGPVSKGMDVDHLCENPPCINPDHLELVTHQENTLRYYRRRTHCRNGHEYTEDNLHWVTQKGNISPPNPTGLMRRCKTCLGREKHKATTGKEES